MGFTILPPDINESYLDFTAVVEDGVPTKNIRFGLGNIKNFGDEIGKAIILERKVRGPFKTIESFLERVTHKNLNKKSVEALAMCGALDALGERGVLIANTETLLQFHKGVASTDSAQSSLFFGMDAEPKSTLVLTPAEPASMETKLAWEKELLGLYLSGHPLDRFDAQIQKSGNSIASLIAGKSIKDQMLVASVESVKIVMTKKNDRMAFVTLRDKTGLAEAILFPESFKELGSIVTDGAIIAVECSVSSKNDRKSLLINKAKTLS
jgi:DNA polymerase-3 subunit alpha